MPFLGGKMLGEVGTDTVRSWRADLAEAGRSEIRIAKAYKLLRAIMNTAADDGRIKGADQEHSPERPVATVPRVFALAGEMPARFRTLVLAAAFTGLRWGELIAPRRCDVDTDETSVRVPRRPAQLSSGQMVAGPTKSAGRRHHQGTHAPDGHGSMRPALIYQQATSERDQEIAEALSRRARAARKKAK